MMTKPPGFASSSTLPLEDEEESIDESLDEILLEANERPSENSAKSLEAVPTSLASDDDDDDAVPMATGEVTVLAPRPTFFDEEVREEETKVDPYETAIRVAATREDGLTSQASQQRDRALRKTTTAPRLSTARVAADDLEFEDADAANAEADDASDAHDARTPADIPIAEDDLSSPAGGYLAGSTALGFQSRLPPPMRSAPPPGRPDIYPGRRIPTPNSDFLPAPGGGFGSGAHYPSIAIPAPSAQDNSARVAAPLVDNRLRLPAVGLVGFLVTAFAGGLFFGAILWRGRAELAPMPMPVVTHVAPRIIAEPVQPIVKPVPPPPAPAAMAPAKPATIAATPVPAPSMPTLAAEAPPAPAAVDPSATARTTTKKSASGSAVRPNKKLSMSDEDAALNGDEPAPPPPPKARKKKAVVWQDPFAQ
jgi:hypothetical protein